MRPIISHVAQAEAQSLALLKAEINREFAIEHRERRASVKRRCKIGSMLIRVKQSLGHGQFIPWIEQNFQGSVRTAQSWVALAERLQDKTVETMSDDVIDEAEEQMRSTAHLSAPQVQSRPATSATARNPVPKPPESQRKFVLPPDAGDAWEPPVEAMSDDAPDQSERKSEQPNSVLLDWTGLHHHKGAIERIIFQFAKLQGQVDERGVVVGPEFNGLLRLLDEVENNLRSLYAARTGKRPPRKPVPDEPLTDAESHPMVAACQQAFVGLARWRFIDSLCQQLQSAIDQVSRHPGGEQLVALLSPTGTEGKTINRSEHLNALKRDLKGTRPHSVCPYCQGTAKPDCKGCGGRAWVTKITWDEAEDHLKVRLS